MQACSYVGKLLFQGEAAFLTGVLQIPRPYKLTDADTYRCRDTDRQTDILDRQARQANM